MIFVLLLLMHWGAWIQGRVLFQTDESSCPKELLQNVTGKVMHTFVQDELISCDGVVLTTRAILTSADCIFNRFGDSKEIAPSPYLNTNKHANLTFEILNDDGTVSTINIQSFLLPTEFRTDDESMNQIAMENNFAVAFLEGELSKKFVADRSNRYLLPDEALECRESWNVVGYLGEEISVDGFLTPQCMIDGDSCDQSCQAQELHNGSPIFECRNSETILRGLYHSQQQVVIDQEKVTTIKRLLQASAASTPLLPIEDINPYTFTNDSAAYIVPAEKQETNLVWWHIFLPAISVFLLMICIIMIIYLIFRYIPKFRRIISPVISYDEETGRDLDLDIDINKQIVETQELGAGGFGIVYRGVWRPRAREVAYKLIRERRAVFGSCQEAAEKEKNEMRQELLFLSSVQHPNILRCYGGQLDPQVAMVMEFCKGGDLYNYVHNVQKGPLSAEQCYSIGYDVASGLAFLHSRNLIHRDIKTKNILRVQQSTEEVGFVKIADFGLTRQIPDGESQQDTLNNMGTLEYMAPELQLNSDGRVKFGPKVDIFALAVVLYECATGLLPWHDVTEKGTIIYQVCQGQRMQIPDHVDPQLKSIISECWNAQADRRPEAIKLTQRFDKLLSVIGGTRGSQLAEQKNRLMKHGSVFPASEISLPPIVENQSSGSPVSTGFLSDSFGSTQDMS
eukprot:TRINITY_DN1427_c0_g1_i1.p1 TRINITY_DN1427_c0_g1~~TRINITY_DN1427_c0_g1_i1.p1  ORF type:complete len:680 (+),score=112.09 TRINITY_DN1427_c0_g1_i1:229-2268(+)